MTDIDIVQRKKIGLLQEYVNAMVASGFSILSMDTDAFLITDPKGSIAYVSRSCERLLGAAACELNHARIEQFLPDVKGILTGPQGEEIVELETELILHNCRYVDVSVTMLPIFCRRERIGHYILFVDRTTIASIEKQKNLELSILSEKLSAAGQLAAGIAHEIRNPLTAIKGFLKLIQSDHTNAEKYHQIIVSEMNRIEMIINELLMLAKPNTLRTEVCNMQELLDQVVKLMEPHALLNGIEVKQNIQLPQTELYCDGNQIKQVMINMIKNAIEAMPDGGRLYIEGNNIGEKIIQIKVKDEGHGIPAEILDKVGDPFFTTKENGTGLGVLVSKQIVENHKGIFSIHTGAKGTCIEIRLPLELTKKYCEKPRKMIR